MVVIRVRMGSGVGDRVGDKIWQIIDFVDCEIKRPWACVWLPRWGEG